MLPAMNSLADLSTAPTITNVMVSPDSGKPLIQSIEDIEKHIPDKEARIETLFSGGVDSCYLLLLLLEKGYTNVHALNVNVGGPSHNDGLETLAERAKALGASFQSLDGRDEFVEVVRSACRYRPRYLGGHPISSSLSRPVIAAKVSQAAKRTGAHIILHTANQSQNSLPRINNGIKIADFSGIHGSPYAHSVIPRCDKIKALNRAGLKFREERDVSCDDNMLVSEFEGGPLLDDPEGPIELKDELYRWTKDVKADRPTEEVTLEFKRGHLVSIDDKAIDGDAIAFRDALSCLNVKAGKFGIGRYYGLEHIHVDLPTESTVTEFREAPAATLIYAAGDLLDNATLRQRDVSKLNELRMKWALECSNGRWAGDEHRRCQETMDKMLELVSGKVTYCLEPWRYGLISVKAKKHIYVRDRDAWEVKTVGKLQRTSFMKF
ncbi:hypothetical protein PFICI_13866 [Pestalotiopsis fici W106-1]|uniref:argininosuccinate synthase n=1 Tax=Pestalotiopsis fici (strain W106-1 / CGMCC3.15140) TaxID=1229662 RepID=W3WJ93_PESFW|nr:uncharacterized protein PFICI_13866 [Pestalotiopsis fici W106-1]ETS74000.1 hypothetical protein PFICI_13866 [Pestalotiopsis fici W106-1]